MKIHPPKTVAEMGGFDASQRVYLKRFRVGDSWSDELAERLATCSDEDRESFFYASAADRFQDLGRPCWIISKDTWEVANSLEVSDEDRARIFEKLPYDSFMFAVERGIFLNFSWGCSELSGVHIFDWRATNCPLPLEVNSQQIIHATFGNHYKCALPLLGPKEIVNPVAALLMLWRSRPEFLVPVRLPRSCRYEFKGNRDLLRTWKFPEQLLVRITQSTVVGSSGRTVRPHYRCGHFRHYRHERYERMQDGSVRVEFIEPCFVGVEVESR